MLMQHLLSKNDMPIFALSLDTLHMPQAESSDFPWRNSGSDTCPVQGSESRTFSNMDRTIVLQLLVTVGHFQTTAGHQDWTFVHFQLLQVMHPSMGKQKTLC